MFISATNFPSKLLPQIHQNPQQQQTHDLWKSRSRARGVAKTVFGIPMLHGKHFFFLIAMQRGNAICDFCNTSPARMRFFSLLPHVPSEKLENHENRILESCCRRVGAKDAKSKSPPKSILPMASTIRTLFLTFEKIQLVYEELCIFLKEYT